VLVEAFGGAKSLKKLRAAIANRVSDDNTIRTEKTDDLLREVSQLTRTYHCSGGEDGSG
jgi:hypothetical protein